MNSYNYVKKNYLSLKEELREIANGVGTPPPTLVAVTKSGTDEELLALAEAGVTDVGENRPGELRRRGELLLQNGYTPRLHEIGTLQRNKIRYIIDSVSLIHSIDSVKLASDVSRLALARGITVPVLIEINSAREEAKGGVMPEDAERLLNDISSLPAIRTVGLMTMGPVTEAAEDIRPYFRLTKKIFDDLHTRYGFGDSPVLSMGMTDSYRIAIEEGSTLVRVGRKLFYK